ncbi:BLUF domain-containing protein [Spongiibacter nanhainus]|uniref:BLUF domain-containing protein n=1 Tax=Spongiibacter nanhainus TaxID=2794344 RepID=A0A7T4UPJ2_9GAMM|nr:BLUF domain-containing protein [Spongiibacter nanhainus]QQD17733.1 BLUF domain-containing protein [Spongiibacter nanhainus]
MKRITCLSTLRSDIGNEPLSPGNLVEIYNTSRVLNRRHGITGVFLVSGRYLLHVIEGRGEHLSKLIYLLNRNDDVIDTSVIADQAIQQPAFSGWTLRVLDNLEDNRQALLEKIAQLLIADIKLHSDRDELRINHFFDLRKALSTLVSQTPSPCSKTQGKLSDIDFRFTTLSLSRWPKPGQIGYTAELINLCTQLVGRTVSYQALNNQGIFKSEADLYANIIKLYRLGKLTVWETSEYDQDRITKNNVTPLTQRTGQYPEKSSKRFQRILKHITDRASQQ